MQTFYTGKLTSEKLMENIVDEKLASLSTVASSGDYDDLLNKPSIPSAQIQADWEQSDNTKLDYIKNKPVIPAIPTNVSSFTNDAGYLTQHQDISGKADTSDIPTKLSKLTDDLGTNPIHTHSQYLTEHQDISGKQDILTAGNNITIQNNIISASGGTISNTTYFSVNNGNKNNLGASDILSYSNSTLSFKVDDGTDYAPLSCTTGNGEQFEKTELSDVDVSELSDGTYNIFVQKTGNQPYLLKNVMFVQKERPSDTDTDVIPTMTSATAPYGTVTVPDGGYWDGYYNLFANGDVSCSGSISSSKPIVYTFDENYQPQAGTYKISYTPPSQYAGQVKQFIITLTDNSQITVSAGNKSESFNLTFTCSLPVKSLNFYTYNASNGTRYGRVRFLKPAILEEGTLWVNNGVEPLEVMARDNNAQWQPFDDVLCGSVTVSSGAVTSVSQPEFNKFSVVNMHNISTTSHPDIRELISDLKLQITSLTSRVTALETQV